MTGLFDDFNGERPDTEDLSVEELHEIYAHTLTALHDHTNLTPNWMWREQLNTIREELEIRERPEVGSTATSDPGHHAPQ